MAARLGLTPCSDRRGPSRTRGVMEAKQLARRCRQFPVASLSELRFRHPPHVMTRGQEAGKRPLEVAPGDKYIVRVVG